MNAKVIGCVIACLAAVFCISGEGFAASAAPVFQISLPAVSYRYKDIVSLEAAAEYHPENGDQDVCWQYQFRLIAFEVSSLRAYFLAEVWGKGLCIALFISFPRCYR